MDQPGQHQLPKQSQRQEAPKKKAKGKAKSSAKRNPKAKAKTTSKAKGKQMQAAAEPPIPSEMKEKAASSAKKKPAASKAAVKRPAAKIDNEPQDLRSYKCFYRRDSTWGIKRGKQQLAIVGVLNYGGVLCPLFLQSYNV